jgi:hypothetical protein
VAQDPLTRDKFRRPELLFQEFLRKGAQGLFKERDEISPFLYRALVLAVDVEGGKLENPDASGGVSHNVNGKKFEVQARLGPKNPPNSIKARILTDGFDKFSTDENLRVFWPFFPENISVPVKPGEHVYVVFEDSHLQHGLWVTKVPGHNGVNYAPGKDYYKPVEEAPLANKFDDTKDVSSEEKKFDKDTDAAETKPGNKLSSLF